MSAPWWHPEANPLADIRAILRKIEEQDRAAYADMFWVAAPNLRQAMEWARRSGVSFRQMQYLNSPAGLYGLRDGTVVVVNGGWPGDPEPWEAHLRVLAATGVSVQRAVT